MFLRSLRFTLLACSLTSHAYGQASTKAASPAQWEYKTVHSDDDLNKLANSGWEFISMASDQQGQHFLLRRPKASMTTAATAPVLLQKVEPEYTAEARAKRIEGDVTLYIVVTKDGVPGEIRVLKSLDRGLDANAILAVKRWRFQPATQHGSPVDTQAQVQVSFRLGAPAPKDDTTIDAWAMPPNEPLRPIPGTTASPTATPPPTVPPKTPPLPLSPQPTQTTEPTYQRPTLMQGSEETERPIPKQQNESKPQPQAQIPRQQSTGTVRWGPFCTTCDERWKRGRLQKGLMIGGVTTWLTIASEGNRFVATVFVLNDSNRAIIVKPDSFTMSIVDPPGKTVVAMPLEKLQQKRSIASRIATAAAGGARGYEGAKNPQTKTGSGTIYNPNGTTSDIDIYGPNTTAKDQDAQARQRRQEQDQHRAQANSQLADSLLLATTVAPGGEVDGLVYFSQDSKKFKEALITFRLSALVFEFPWSDSDRK